MQDAFGTVLVVVVVVGIAVAVLTLSGARASYDEIGKGGLSLGDGSDRPPDEPTGSGGAAIRDEEIRQMLQARNARRARRGEEPLDIEAEIAAMTRPALDPGLLAEIRDLVEARNARRIRRGEEPLDVEAEVARQMKEFS